MPGCGGHGVALWHCPQAVPKPDGWVAVPLPAASPTLHPVQSPQTRFCVLTVAPDTLPAIATMLIDVLFYSHRWVPGTGTQQWPLARCHLNRSDMFPPPSPLAPSGFSSSGCVLRTGFALPSVLGGCGHGGCYGSRCHRGHGNLKVTQGTSPPTAAKPGEGVLPNRREWVAKGWWEQCWGAGMLLAGTSRVPWDEVPSGGTFPLRRHGGASRMPQNPVSPLSCAWPTLAAPQPGGCTHCRPCRWHPLPFPLSSPPTASPRGIPT